MLGNHHNVVRPSLMIFVRTTIPAHIQAIDPFYVQLLAHRLYLLRSIGRERPVAAVMWKWIVIGWQQLNLLLLYEGSLLLSLAHCSNDICI